MTSKKIGIVLIGLVMVISIGVFFTLGYRAEVTSPITITKTTTPTTYTTYTILGSDGQNFSGNLTTPVQAGNATMDMFSFSPTSLTVWFNFHNGPNALPTNGWTETFTANFQAGVTYTVNFANYSFKVTR